MALICSSLMFPHAKSWLIGKDPDAGRDWGQEKKGTTGWDGWMASPTWWTWVWVDSGSWWWTGRPSVLRFMGSQSQTRLRNWTELNWMQIIRCWAFFHVLIGHFYVFLENHLFKSSVHFWIGFSVFCHWDVWFKGEFLNRAVTKDSLRKMTLFF